MNTNDIVKIITGGRTKRDRQVNIGPSEIGGCSRRVWHRINEDEETNETLRLASWMGTAIHTAIEKRLRAVDPFGDRYMIEVEVEADGLMGHVDCYDKEEKSVMDWKTTTKKNMSKFPTDQQKMQVQLYGYLLTCNGYEVDTVTLVAIPRDGNELDIRQHSEPYDESVALSGLEWLHNVRHMQEPPAPEKHKRFCQDYCGFFGSVCEGG